MSTGHGLAILALRVFEKRAFAPFSSGKWTSELIYYSHFNPSGRKYSCVDKKATTLAMLTASDNGDLFDIEF